MLRLRLWLGFALALFCLWLASWKFHPPPAPSPRLFVFQSSAAPRGRGLYAGRELAAEEALGQYPGMILSDSQRTRLSTVLHRNAESFLDKERVIFSPSFLLAKLNFSVVGDAIDWAALLKSFEAYLFAFLGSDHKLNFITWMKFDAAGNAVIDTTEENLMLFVNEPPKAEFLNVISGKMQPAEPNVQSKNVPNGVLYYALRRIEVGEELLICYGPFYAARDYEINEPACPREKWTLT